jgi:RimJ/RimL family protein N-acetyltransferase
MAKSTHPDIGTPIQTERFLLKPIGRLETFRISYPWNQDPEVMREYSGSGEGRGRLQWYRHMPRENRKNKFAHAIYPIGADKPIGLHFIEIKPYKTAYLTIVIQDRAWWGKGAVFEIRQKVFDHVIEHSDVEKFSGFVNSRNFPSIFNYKKLGFKHVGTMQRTKFDPTTGTIYDTVIFEMFRHEWQARKSSGNG